MITTGTQIFAGQKTFTSAIGITNANPSPNIWAGYSKSKLNAHPAFVFDGGTGNQPICTNMFGGTVGGNDVVLFAYFGYGTSSNAVGNIGSQGTSTIYGTTSDYRLKENITPMSGALGKVAQLKPVTYTWKSNNSAGQGFIAHELQAVIPDAVIGTKDEVHADGKPKYQGVDTSFLVATLTAAIQEQQAIIEDLKNRVTALEAV